MEEDRRGCTILLAAVRSGSRDAFKAALDALGGDLLIKVSSVASGGSKRMAAAIRTHSFPAIRTISFCWKSCAT